VFFSFVCIVFVLFLNRVHGQFRRGGSNGQQFFNLFLNVPSLAASAPQASFGHGKKVLSHRWAQINTDEAGLAKQKAAGPILPPRH